MKIVTPTPPAILALVLSKPFLPAVALLLTAAVIAATPPPRPAAPASAKPADGVRILEVLPSQLTVGVEQEVFVRVRYDLKSLDQAQLNLSFNVSDSAKYRTFTKEIVNKGAGETILTARVIPRDWGDLVFFQASVSLVEIVPPSPPRPAGAPPRPPPSGRPVLAFDHAPIPLTPKKS